MNDEFFVDNLEEEEKPTPRRRSPWFLFAIILVIFLLIWPGFVGFYTEWLWFQEVGYQQVFSTMLLTKLGLGVGAFLIGALFIWINLSLALRLSKGRGNIVRYITVNNERVAIPDIAGFIERWVLPLSLARFTQSRTSIQRTSPPAFRITTKPGNACAIQ